MLHALLMVFVFLGIAAAALYGVSWAVDNQSEIRTATVGGDDRPSITELAKGVVSDEENAPEEIVREDVVDTADSLPVAEGASARAEVAVKILNGGAASGAAGKAQALLKKEGYEKAAAGNAQSYTHKGIVVYFTSGAVAEAEEVIQVLSANAAYSGAIAKEAETQEQKQSDIVVILGE